MPELASEPERGPPTSTSRERPDRGRALAARAGPCALAKLRGRPRRDPGPGSAALRSSASRWARGGGGGVASEPEAGPASRARRAHRGGAAGSGHGEASRDAGKGLRADPRVRPCQAPAPGPPPRPPGSGEEVDGVSDRATKTGRRARRAPRAGLSCRAEDTPSPAPSEAPRSPSPTAPTGDSLRRRARSFAAPRPAPSAQGHSRTPASSRSGSEAPPPTAAAAAPARRRRLRACAPGCAGAPSQPQLPPRARCMAAPRVRGRAAAAAPPAAPRRARCAATRPCPGCGASPPPGPAVSASSRPSSSSESAASKRGPARRLRPCACAAALTCVPCSWVQRCHGDYGTVLNARRQKSCSSPSTVIATRCCVPTRHLKAQAAAHRCLAASARLHLACRCDSAW